MGDLFRGGPFSTGRDPEARADAATALARLDALPNIRIVTQSQYDALPAPDANTLYVIVEG